MNISGMMKSTGAALEAQAFKQFGAAVEGATGGLLNGIFGGSKGAGGPFIGPDDGTSPISAQAASELNSRAKNGLWDPTKYAAAIASSSGNYDPKSRFLFKVKFEFNQAVAQAAASMFSGLKYDINDISRDITFVIKQIDLPKVDFQYEEVNMYNFRTKILKQIQNRELNMILLDDTGNHALNFINAYRVLLMPIGRMPQSPSMALEDHGMDFNVDYKGLDTANRGALPGNARQILDKLTIEQFYLDRTAQRPIDSIKVNSFVFVNPRITEFDISDQDHESSGEPSTITTVFNFDALYIETGNAGVNHVTPSLPGGDILSGSDSIPSELKRSPDQRGKAGNPFVDIIANQGSRMIQSSVSGALNKALGGVAGGALSGAIGQVSGALGSAAKGTLSGQGNSIASGISMPSIPFVRDNSAPAGASDLSSRNP